MDININWYRKDPISPSRKLEREIMDVLPFDVDRKLAKKIMLTIIDCMKEGLARDNKVVIDGFGKLYIRHRPSMLRGTGKPGEVRVTPPKNIVTFEASKSLRKALREYERTHSS